MAEPRIAAAVMTAVVSGDLGRQTGLGKAIERAVSQAVTDALAEGISMDDTATMLARQHAARQAVIARVKAAV